MTAPGGSCHGRTDEQDVRLRQLNLVVQVRAKLNSFVVVVDRYGKDLLRVGLANDVGVEELVDLRRRWQAGEIDVSRLGKLLTNISHNSAIPERLVLSTSLHPSESAIL